MANSEKKSEQSLTTFKSLVANSEKKSEESFNIIKTLLSRAENSEAAKLKERELLITIQLNDEHKKELAKMESETHDKIWKLQQNTLGMVKFDMIMDKFIASIPSPATTTTAAAQLPS